MAAGSVGSIIFETALDNSSLEQSLSESLRELKRFGESGAKAIQKITDIHPSDKKFGDKLFNNMLKSLDNVSEKFDILSRKANGEMFTGLSADAVKLRDSLVLVNREIETVMNEISSGKHSTGEIQDLKVRLGELVEAGMRLREEFAQKVAIENISEEDITKVNELRKNFDEIKIATLELQEAERKLAETEITHGQDSLEFAKAAEMANKKEEALRKLIDAQQKLLNAEAIQKKKENITQEEIDKYAEEATAVTKLEALTNDLEKAKRKLAETAVEYGKDSEEYDKAAEAVRRKAQAIEDLHDKERREAEAAERAAQKQAEAEQRRAEAAERAAQKEAERQQREADRAAAAAAKAAQKEAERKAAEEQKRNAEKTARGTQIATAAFKGLNSVVNSTISLFKKFGSAALSAISKVTIKPLINSFKTLGRVAASAISKGITAPFKALAKPLQSFSTKWDHSKKLLTKVTIYKGLRMMMQQIVKALKEGVEALYRWGEAQNSGIGSDFVKSLDKIVTALSYLKHTVVAVFTPVVNYFAPLIDKWLDNLVEKINTVSASIASAFGESTFVKAVKVPKTYAEMLDSANKKSKELKRSLMSFDKLNRLDGDKNKDDETDYSKYFEVADVANQKIVGLKTLMNKFLNGDLKSFGTKLGKRLQKITKQINKFFKETDFQKIGEQIAEFFNGLIEQFDGKELGKLFGNAFKAILDTITGFARKINATKLGEAIANMFIGIVEVLKEIDIADTIQTIFDAISDTFTGFINKLFEEDEAGNNVFKRISNILSTSINSAVNAIRNDPNITENISKLVFGLFDLISTTLENIDWQAMAATGLRLINSLFVSLVNIIKQIDTKKMADTINGIVHTLLADGSLLNNILKLLQALFEGGATLLIEIFKNSGTEIAATITDGINRIFTYLSTDEAQETLKELFESFTLIIDKIITTLDWKLIATTFIKSLGSALSGIEDASPLISGIIKLLTGLFIGGNLLKIVNGVVTTVTGKGLFSTIFSKLFASEGSLGLFSKIGAGFKGVGAGIGKIAAALGTSVGALAAAFAAVVAAVVLVIKNWESLKEAGKMIVEQFDIWSDNIKLWADGVDEKIEKTFKELPEKVSKLVTKLKTKITEQLDKIITAVVTFTTDLEKKAKEGINKVISLVNKLISGINKIHIDMPDWAEKLTGISSIGFNIPDIPEVKIPRLATGTVVPANFGQFAAILGDNRTEPEVVSPLSTMKQAFKEAISEMGGFRIDSSDVYIDGQKIGRIVFDIHNDTVTRTGKTPLKGV